jgi:hypothetical protein
MRDLRGRGRVRTGAGGGDGPLHAVIFDGHRAGLGRLQRKHPQPPFHDAVGFREKAVPPDINAIPVVVHSPGNAAHVVAFLNDNGLNVGFRQQLVGGRQPCRAGANNDRPSIFHAG